MHQAPDCMATTQTLFQTVFSRGSLVPLGMTSKTIQPSPVVDCFKDHYSIKVYKITTRSVCCQGFLNYLYMWGFVFVFLIVSLTQNSFTEVREGEVPLHFTFTMVLEWLNKVWPRCPYAIQLLSVFLFTLGIQ